MPFSAYTEFSYTYYSIIHLLFHSFAYSWLRASLQTRLSSHQRVSTFHLPISITTLNSPRQISLAEYNVLQRSKRVPALGSNNRIWFVTDGLSAQQVSSLCAMFVKSFMAKGPQQDPAKDLKFFQIEIRSGSSAFLQCFSASSPFLHQTWTVRDDFLPFTGRSAWPEYGAPFPRYEWDQGYDAIMTAYLKTDAGRRFTAARNSLIGSSRHASRSRSRSRSRSADSSGKRQQRTGQQGSDSRGRQPFR